MAADHADSWDKLSPVPPAGAVAAQPVAPAAPSFWDKMKHAVAVDAGALVKGVNDVPGMFMNLPDALLNRTGLPQRIIGAPLSEDMGGDARRLTGLPEGSTPGERIVSEGGAGLVTGLGVGGLARTASAGMQPSVMRSALQEVGNAPVADALGGAGSGAAGQGAQEAGLPWWAQVAASLTGGLAGGLVGGGGHNPYEPKARPQVEPMVEAPLDGGVPPGGGPSIWETLGVDPAQFSSPEVAAAVEARARSAVNRPNPNLGDAVAAGIGSKRVNQAIDDFQATGVVPPSRVVPPDVTMIAAPEGVVRSDDAGGQVAVERQRAANRAVLGQASDQAADNPTLAHILDTDIATQKKVAVLWDQLHKDPPAGPTPFQSSTVEDAGALRSEASGLYRDGSSWNAQYSAQPASDGSFTLERVLDGKRQHLRDDGMWHDGTAPKAAVSSNRGAIDNPVLRFGSADEALSHAGDDAARMGGSLRGKKPEMPYRMSAPDGTAIDGVYSGISRPVEGRNLFGAPREPRTTMGDAENVSAKISPTLGERERGTPADLQAPMGAGGSDRLFKSGADDHFWEDRAHTIHQDEFAKAQAHLEEEWAQRRAQAGANQRFQDERVRGEQETAGDPSNLYRDKYDQKPVKSPTNADAWHMTKEGFVAGKEDRPVAFRNAKEAARWAAANKMGGDFELGTWKTNSGRIVLRRREGSTYGERPAPSPAEPTAAGPDAQRLLAGPREETPGVASGAEQADNIEQGGDVASGNAESASERPRPTDALTFIARNGGIASETNHNLRKGGREMPQFAPGGGHLFRKNGKSIDEIGELLHEAGYFKGERPTEADVLELLHKAEFERQYRPEDVETVRAHQASDENAHWEARARSEVADVAAEHEHHLTDKDTNRVLELMGSGKTAHEAYREHIEEQISNHLDAMSREAGDQGYDFHDHPIGQDDRGSAAGDTGSARVEDDTGGSAAAPRDAGETQGDAFGHRAGDERRAAERAADGRLKGEKPQKAPGSDGGLFDGGRDREMFKHGDQADSPSGSRPLSEHLTDLAGLLRDPRQADLARRLSGLVGNARIHFGRGDLPEGVAGATRYGGKNEPIHVSVRGADPETALHEAIHVAVMARYRDLAVEGDASPHIADLNALRERALKSYRKATDMNGIVGHALADTDEFMAYGLTSPTFQRWLQSRGTAGLWQRFVNSVRGMLGLEPKYGSMLDAVLRSGNGVIDGARKVAPYPDAFPQPRERFAHDPIDPKEPGPDGWKRVAGLVFEKDMLEHEGAGLVDAVKSVYGAPKAAIGKVADRLRAFGEVAAYSADGAARSLSARFEAPTIAKLADLFHAEAGVTNKTVGRTYGEAVSKETTRYLGDLHAALKPFMGKEASMTRIRDMLATPDRPVGATTAERAAASTVRDLLKDLLEYRLDAGEDIGMVRDGYFPRITRLDKVAAKPEAFRQAAIKVYKDIGHEAPEEAAEALLTNAINGSMNISDAQVFGGGGKPSSSKAREFGKSADTHLRDFYETNPMRALADYIGSATRRAEEARRFGPKGRTNTPERADWMKANGDRSQWDVMKRKIQAELRAKGADARGVMERVEAIRGTNLGHRAPGEIKAGATVSVIHAWNQLGTLGQATFASLPEMAMGFVRGGPRYGFTHLSTTFSEFARNVRKLPASDAKRYAEAAGAVGSDTALDLIRARADDPTQHVAVQKLLHNFYRKTGLEQWTDAGRTAAVKTGQRFVDALAHDLQSSSARTKVRAAGYLRELGVSDPDAFGAFVRKGAPSLDDVRGDKGMAAEYSTALLRFANQSVLLPTRAVKPTWASHPLGSLLFALQSYNYAFKKNVLDRVGRETLAAIKEQDPQKLAAAGGMVVLAGTTALIQGLRHTIYGTPEGGGEETPMHYALETLDRTGLFGAASPLLNAFEGLRYKRSVGNVLLGSVAGRVVQAVDAASGVVTQNSDNTNSAERKAAGAVYDMAIRPAEDAIGASVLRGGLGSAAILGTGGKGNGIALNDKDAFQTMVAGPQEERDEPADSEEEE